MTNGEDVNAIHLLDSGSEPQRVLNDAETDQNAVWNILDRGLEDLGTGCPE